MSDVSDRPVLEDGMVTGLIGAGTVAVWFLLLDSLRGLSFFTPTLLGSVIFDRMPAADVTDVSVKTVFAYSGLHVIMFLMVGWCVAWIFREFEAHPPFGLVYLLTFLLFEVIVFGLEVAMMPDVLGIIGTWAVAIGNILSLIAMFGFLMRRHPDSMNSLVEGYQA